MTTVTKAPAFPSRRFLFQLARAALVFASVAATGAAPALAQGAAVPPDQLMAPGALPDLALGSADAPITIVEYASMTCSHCAAFHTTTFPVLKSKYIDTGKVRFILREFPLDPLATAGFMLARCAGDDKRNAIVDLLFAQQKNWAFTEKPVEALAGLLKQAGVGQEAFEACLKNQELYNNVNKVRDNASAKFNVTATPTFFINGKKESGEISPETLDKLLEPLLKG
ncbi:DsbA family protein [Methylocella silvestris]|uniref:Disulfide bond formation protein DsbA n=1 Tax=Methylocella silvestris TaxID=199596 RepID=A0A2J7TCZ3_METSI|nr:DsbA family protein [Methylocella silvestris]PNG24628.1 disulfide bond formation protein DsbA [Methylocella silvestris]